MGTRCPAALFLIICLICAAGHIIVFGMVTYVKESLDIFWANLAEMSGTMGILGLVFLFAVFLIFFKASKGFGHFKKE